MGQGWRGGGGAWAEWDFGIQGAGTDVRHPEGKRDGDQKEGLQRMRQGLVEVPESLGGGLGRGREPVRACEVPGAIVGGVGGMGEQGSLESSPWRGACSRAPPTQVPRGPIPTQPTGESPGLRTSSSPTSPEVPAIRCPSPGGSSLETVALAQIQIRQQTSWLGGLGGPGQGEWPHVCPDERLEMVTSGGPFLVAGQKERCLLQPGWGRRGAF